MTPWDDDAARQNAWRSRRALLRDAGLLLSFSLSGCAGVMSPAAARRAGAKPRVLSAEETDTLEWLAESLVPGSAESGVALFVDTQLAEEDSSLLMLKYLGIPPAARADFYRGALAAARRLREAQPGGEDPAYLIATGRAEDRGWEGPPSGFFAFVLRADAIDVQYGTPEGFARLGIPYMAHIEPPEAW